ncbi:MAG TPA: hypothetical protein VLB90_11095, partial [Pseudomonadales bacterium]|nr:hypothetical protein [Pseudomonadales bacterium]
ARRAICIGLLAAIGLHLKWLLAPAFTVISTCFCLHLFMQKQLSFFTASKLLVLILLPVVILHGGWYLWKQQALSGYSDAYLSAYKQYGDGFFRYHGSGVGQWQDATNKAFYLSRNFNKNLYFVEESLAEYGIKNPFVGDAPADENHIIAWLLIAGLVSAVVFTLLKIRKKDTPDTNWIMLAFSLIILAYLAWFAIFSMAMSPSHFYFQNQWLLWMTLLALSQSRFAQYRFAPLLFPVLLMLLSISTFMNIDQIQVQKPDAMQQATNYIQKTAFATPLAGCGYSGYPRHIEYLLPNSQNFADCLDLIDDHVELQDGHYRWKSPLAFNLVFSLQSAGTNNASTIVLGQCKDNMLYRNDEVIIMSCSYADLQKIDLDLLMSEAQKTHHWYSTRIKP